jgi:limonene-1,2-epoxide hydrolase
MSNDENAIDLVRRFCDAWGTGDIPALIEYFAEDAVYHNIPIDPVTGRDAIRTTIEGFTGGMKVEFIVNHIAAAGDVVLTERIDVFTAGDKVIRLPVMGTFEVRDGRITAWRDYFDLNQFMSQFSA